MKKQALHNKHAVQGFTLIELAMVMMIMGLLLGGLFAAVGDSANNLRRSTTSALLKQVEEALYGFAQVNARLPCPADENGAEDCGLEHGFIPNQLLGISGAINEDGLLLDAWQNPLRYSVFAAFTNTAGVEGMFTALSTDFRICSSSDCSAVIASNIPAVVISMGANWPTIANGDLSSTDEVMNAAGGTPLGAFPVTNTPDFVHTTEREDYDDQISWLSPHLLFGRIVRAGHLP